MWNKYVYLDWVIINSFKPGQNKTKPCTYQSSNSLSRHHPYYEVKVVKTPDNPPAEFQAFIGLAHSAYSVEKPPGKEVGSISMTFDGKVKVRYVVILITGLLAYDMLVSDSVEPQIKSCDLLGQRAGLSLTLKMDKGDL